jgi:hypothetical protein
MDRRSAVRRLLLGTGLGWLAGGVAPRNIVQSQGQRRASLQDILETGLKARLPREFRFIRHIVQMVNDGDLPLELVMSTYHWARKKTRYKQYAFPYFEQGLRIRAARQGIAI